MNDRPLLNRISLASHRALMIWSITYAMNHRDEISPEMIARMRQGNQAERKASQMLSLFMPIK
jgi:hypothetical protein